MNIPNLWWGWKILDICLIPLMWVLNKGRWEKPQEKHHWHSIPWKGSINPMWCVINEGSIKKHKHFSPWFHMPILGTGWEHYLVVQPIRYTEDWYIGWGSGEKNVINLKTLYNGEPVRVLISDGYARFFGCSKDGTQIPLQIIGEGYLGDPRFRHIRQF